MSSISGLQNIDTENKRKKLVIESEDKLNNQLQTFKIATQYQLNFIVNPFHLDHSWGSFYGLTKGHKNCPLDQSLLPKTFIMPI